MFYLTIDIGTTALKTALVDSHGRLTAIHTTEYRFRSPHPGWAELAPDVYWEAMLEGTRSVFYQSQADPSRLVAIGFSSQGQTFIPIDSSSEHLHDAIVWVDSRAGEIVESWEAEWLTRDDYRRVSGYPRLPVELTVFKIAWLARNISNAHKAWKFLCLPDYLIYRMTGEIATDRTIAQFSGLFDIHKQLWESRLLDAAGISADQLPEVLPSGQVAGCLRAEAAEAMGIPVGVPVCVGANDQIAGALGAGNICPGIVSETTGTALAVVVTTQKLIDDSRIIVGRHAGNAYFAMPYANTSAIVLKWFRDIVAAGQDYGGLIDGAENIPAGCDGLTVLPHFSGTASPTFNQNARGVFAGLTLGHTRLHIVRAIMESCACLLKECLKVVEDCGVAVRGIRSLGGAARSDLWLQIKADMLGLPVERPACSDAASLGAAMLAAVGAGQFGTIEEASEAWYRPACTLEPDPSRIEIYRDVFARYQLIYNRLYGQEE